MNKTPSASFSEDNGADLDIAFASQWQLMWMRFRRHKLALVGEFSFSFYTRLLVFVSLFPPISPISATLAMCCARRKKYDSLMLKAHSI